MKKLAVVIPAYNEEKVLPATLRSLNPTVNPSDIYLLSDGSTDKTIEIARRFGINYTQGRKNLGKPKRLQSGLKKFQLLKKYQFIFTLDADTRPEKDFFRQALGAFEKDNIACVCGHVLPEKKPNIFIIYRSLIYLVWQNLYKSLCSWINAIPIAPGTASIYKTSALKKMSFDPNLIIEDFDLTFQIHRKRLGRIVYVPQAKVVTQDPDKLSEYFKQTTRWQLGFFQTAKKHRLPFGGQPFEVALAFFLLQEILHSLYVISLICLVAWLQFFALYPSLLGFYLDKTTLISLLIFDAWLIIGLSILMILKTKRLSFLPFLPFLWLVQFVNIAAFLKALYLALFKSISGAWRSPKRW